MVHVISITLLCNIYHTSLCTFTYFQKTNSGFQNHGPTSLKVSKKRWRFQVIPYQTGVISSLYYPAQTKHYFCGKPSQNYHRFASTLILHPNFGSHLMIPEKSKNLSGRKFHRKHLNLGKITIKFLNLNVLGGFPDPQPPPFGKIPFPGGKRSL